MRTKLSGGLVVAILATTAGIGIAGCASSNSSSSATSSATAAAHTSPMQKLLMPYLKPPTTLSVSTPLSKRPPAGKSIYYLNQGITIAQENGLGVQAASEALGWNYHSLAVNAGNPSTIVSGMLSAINAGANVVVINATPTVIYKSALATAEAHGTLIIDASSGNTPIPGVTAYVNRAVPNGLTFGRMEALEALASAAQAGKTAHVLIATSPAFATILGPIDVAIGSTITKYCRNCTVQTLNVGYGQIAAGAGPAAVVSYLQSHPDVNYVLQDANFLDQGLPQALKAAGLSGVKIIGDGALAPQLDELKAGTEEAWVDVPLQVEGWMEVDAAARALVGDDAAVYNNAEMPSYLLTQADPTAAAEVPVDYAELFKKMWHVS